MVFSTTDQFFEGQGPIRSEIAVLAEKFYSDSTSQGGYDRQSWLCAEYMLTQKHLIEYQISTLHDRGACPLN